ncbi:hypothetical protein [Paenibacillus sp. IHBB 3054]|uniref:hypothetical protein n=1 Tax=Paenibacillus sp. IHBB 3054 TaxID=3425689 RepID=UPI003F676571
MNLNELWSLYEADKRIQGFSPKTLKAYALQHKMLVLELGNLDVTEVTLTILKEYLAKQAVHLKTDKIVVLMTPLSVQEERIWKRYEERIAGIVPNKKRETLEGIHNLLAWNKDYNLTKLPNLIGHWDYKHKMILVRDNLDLLELQLM